VVPGARPLPHPIWNELFRAEQARVIQLLVERVDVSPEGVDIRLRTE
jgi:site-specific DNA recombinase